MEYGERGEKITDDNFLLLMNAHSEEIPFTLPSAAQGANWRSIVDTTRSDQSQRSVHSASQVYPLKGRSLALLIEHQANERRNGL